MNSHAYVYFSDYEGFGFGPVQAMAAEVPSIVNSSSCLPEITQGASMLVDTSDLKSVVESLEKIISEESIRSSLIEKGKSVAKTYNWTETATKTLDELKALLERE
jgi:glycosyltransferase involved in cell wall biosynthesis